MNHGSVCCHLCPLCLRRTSSSVLKEITTSSSRRCSCRGVCLDVRRAASVRLRDSESLMMRGTPDHWDFRVPAKHYAVDDHDDVGVVDDTAMRMMRWKKMMMTMCFTLSRLDPELHEEPRCLHSSEARDHRAHAQTITHGRVCMYTQCQGAVRLSCNAFQVLGK
eukprot:72922-Rhodomonas_salina.2